MDLVEKLSATLGFRGIFVSPQKLAEALNSVGIALVTSPSSGVSSHLAEHRKLFAENS